MHEYIETIRDYPVIAAVQSQSALSAALGFRMPTVFLLNTDIFSAKASVDFSLAEDCHVFLHMDLIDGLAASAKALDYVQHRISPSGIISTKSALIKYAREQGVFCIQRFFMVDSVSYDNAVKATRRNKPNMVELMPGIIPRCCAALPPRSTRPSSRAALSPTGVRLSTPSPRAPLGSPPAAGPSGRRTRKQYPQKTL